MTEPWHGGLSLAVFTICIIAQHGQHPIARQSVRRFPASTHVQL